MTILGITFGAAVIWIITAGLLAIIEAFTLGLTTIWFAGGAVCASAAAMFGAPVIVQIAVFLAISVLLLVITRPIVKRRLNDRTEKTNVEAIIGQEGIAEEDISQYMNGQVRADGKIWSATCETGEIKRGSVVIIKSIKGVTLTVEEKR